MCSFKAFTQRLMQLNENYNFMKDDFKCVGRQIRIQAIWMVSMESTTVAAR
jgi:hypothetical protein